MAVARNWMLMNRRMRGSKLLRNREENKDDIVNLDFNEDPPSLMNEILINICKRHGISTVRKLNYLNAFVHLLTKTPDWKSVDTFGFTFEEIVSCLRIALIQDSVQVRAAGLRALRYVVRNEENVLSLNKLHFTYLIARSLDLLLKTDNERVLMSERIQALKMMRHILSIAPQHFSPALVRPLVSVVLKPVEETDRLSKACIATLCELCILNSAVFIECDGVRALLRNAVLIPSSHIVETICGTLLFLLNKPSVRESAKVDLNILISGYTNSSVSEKNSFREEERRLTGTNFALLTMLRSCGGIFELCNNSSNGLKSIVQLLYLNKSNVRKAILELLFNLLNIPEPNGMDEEHTVADFIEMLTFRESFKMSEGFVISEGEHFLPSLTKNGVNLIEVHSAMLLVCLLEAGLPDALVEVIVSGETTVSQHAAILLGELLNLAQKLLPAECYVSPPALPNLVSYAVRGCPLQLPLFTPVKDNYKQYSHSFSHYPKDTVQIVDGTVKSYLVGDDSTKTLDLRLSYPNLDVPENRLTKSSYNGISDTKDKAKSSTDSSDQDFIEDFASHASAEVSAGTAVENVVPTTQFWEAPELPKLDEFLLNANNTDLPSCKEKQKKALSAVDVLYNLQKHFEKAPHPVSLLLSNVAQYGDHKQSGAPSNTANVKEKMNKVSMKELEELLKETNVLIVSEPSRWKWETIRILLRLSMNNSKILSDANFKSFLKKLVHFFKPSSKKFSHTPSKAESMGIHIHTLVACDLFDILLDTRTVDGLKILSDFIDDLGTQLGEVAEVKSVHDCLLSPLRLNNTLSQDYFLFLGRLSDTDIGLSILEKNCIFQKLQQIACNINLDCYVKLIVSSLSYVHSDITRKLLSSVLSCRFASSRLYATKYLLVLLRTGVKKSKNFQYWIIEMLINQLCDENQTIAMIALNLLNEASDDKVNVVNTAFEELLLYYFLDQSSDYLEALVSLRPSLLHLGDTGLLLLIRFLSTENGFAYLQAANFVIPQLQRWANSFNVKYVQIVECELHDALSQYQRGDDGRYRKRITGLAAKLKNVIVPPHLYGQLVQHAQGFELLLKQDNINSLMQTILIGYYDSERALTELKAALWAMGHFATSSMGAKYLHGYGVIKAIVMLAETCNVYSVKMTAVYILSMIATTKEGVAILNTTRWRCLKRRRHSNPAESVLTSASWEKLMDYDDGETVLSPSDSDSPQSDSKLDSDTGNGSVVRKIMNKFKSATLPQRAAVQIQHSRSFSESKADVLDDWSSSGFAQSNFQTYISEMKSHALPNKYRSDSFGTDSTTSGISSCDSIPGKPSTYSERLPTLSPIPSSSSLTTIMTNIHDRDHSHRSFLSKRHSSINFGVRLNTQYTLGYKTLRFLQNRHQLSNFPQFSASATMEYLSAPERRQMSPLVRPRFPGYLQKPSTPDFEIRSTPFQIDANESLNFSSAIESSQFSHSTEIDEDRCEFEGPCYQGICLPLKMSYLLPTDLSSARSSTYVNKASAPTHKCNEEFELSGDSDSERVKSEDINRTHMSRVSHKRRRHDKSTCMLCSEKPNTMNDKNLARSRRTSTSSIHRIRTETESSYGGGIGFENDSPILLTWQQKPAGLVDNTPGGASSGTLENSDLQSSSGLPNNENSMNSRLIMRKEVLKLVEQLGNPVLYRTCKQGLLHLKQICGDLFQDICLFSDVCFMLATINYRIQARQLIQDLFLDAPFHELYEEVNGILNGSAAAQEAEDSKSTPPHIPTTVHENYVPQSDTRSSQLHVSPSAPTSKDTTPLDVPESKCEELSTKTPSTNAGLEVIIEAETVSESSKSGRNSASQCDKCDSTVTLPIAADRCVANAAKHTKNLYDCRRAHSYPATNYPEATLKQHFMFSHQQRIGFEQLNSFNPFVLDGQLKNFTNPFSQRSVISFGDRSSSVVLAFENPCNVIDLDSRLLIDAVDTKSNAIAISDLDDDDDDDDDCANLGKNESTVVSRRRKFAEFEPPDKSALLLERSNSKI